MAESTSSANSLPVKIIAGADPFGADLKNHLVNHIRTSLSIPVDDLGTGPYYSIAASVGSLISSSQSTGKIVGLLCCGTGCGVSMFANKFPGAFAATCLSPEDAVNARSISNANIVAFSALSTPPAAAEEILSAFLSTPYKSPCPANNNLPWPSDILEFLDKSLEETPQIGAPSKPSESDPSDSCAVCCLAKNRELTEIELIAGGKMKILRESPTSAVVRFAAGSVEPAHHHTFGHCLIVMEGRKSVWNLTKEQRYDLVVGDYLFTPAGDVHRVVYHEDTEFFIKWDGKWDMFFDEDAETARKAVQEALTS